VGAVGAQGDSVDVYLDQLLDDSGDEVLNVDDTGVANATARGWQFDSINTGNLSVDNFGVSVRLSSSVSVPDTTETQLPFNTLTYDDTGEFDTSTHEFTATDTGKYLCIVSADFKKDSGWSTGDVFTVSIRVNGGLQFEATAAKAGTVEQSASQPGIVELNAGDTVDASVFQKSGSSKTVASVGRKTYLMISQVA
jgi:hypothetical protein